MTEHQAPSARRSRRTPKRAPARKKRRRDQLIAVAKRGEEREDGFARTVLTPVTQAAVTVKQYTKVFGDLEVAALMQELVKQGRAVRKGGTDRAEEMMAAQAHTLDAMFHALARRAVNSDYMKNLDTYLRLALRAQAQSRATWEAISAIKHPPVTSFVGQANIAHGPQQVNNHPSPSNVLRQSSETPSLESKLLEAPDGERLDAGASSAAGRADTDVAAMGAVHRPKDRGR